MQQQSLVLRRLFSTHLRRCLVVLKGCAYSNQRLWSDTFTCGDWTRTLCTGNGAGRWYRFVDVLVMGDGDWIMLLFFFLILSPPPSHPLFPLPPSPPLLDSSSPPSSSWFSHYPSSSFFSSFSSNFRHWRATVVLRMAILGSETCTTQELWRMTSSSHSS